VLNPVQPLKLYALDPTGDGSDTYEVRVVESYNPIEDGATIASVEGTATDDQFASYMADSQERRGLFSRHRMPVGTRRLGRQASLGVSVGYHPTPIFGRLETGDLDVSDGSQAELLEWVYNREPRAWNLVQVGAVARVHPFTLVHVEARGSVEWTPLAEVSGGEGALLAGRALVGLGLSGHLGSRSWMGHLGAGGGLLFVDAEDMQQQDTVLARYLQPPSLYAAAGVVVLRPGVNLTVDLVGHLDQVNLEGSMELPSSCRLPLWSNAPGEDSDLQPFCREYTSVGVSVGMDIGRWPF